MEYIYARVSTEKQDTDTQIDLLKKTSPNALVFKEIVSGTKYKPELAKLMNEIKKGDTLYVYKYDRISRTMDECMYIIGKLQSKGVHVVSVTQPIDRMDASGKMMLQLFAVFAEYERNLISERTKAKLSYLKEQGVSLGGYRKGSGGKGLGPLSDAERDFLKELRERGNVNWVVAAHDFKTKFGKDYKPSTLKRKLLVRKKQVARRKEA